MADLEFSNDDWALALDLLAQMTESSEPELIIAAQSDDSIRRALEYLWRQHKQAEEVHFLEERITVVNEMGASGPPIFQPGQLLADRFAILRILGQGGMGEVYLANDQLFSETVAIKTMRRELARDKDNRDRFLAEVQNSRHVTHLHVCRIFDLFEHNGVVFYSMEYLGGPTLAEVLASGRLNAGRAKILALQIAEGLLAAHKNSILHCDLKPANIILTGSAKNERAVITDFGLGRALDQTEPKSHGAFLAGTPLYMAPELRQGQSASVRTDIYAFGKVLEALIPGHSLSPHCSALDANSRPESMASVLERLNDSSSRRQWIGGSLLGSLVAAAILYLQSRPRIPLGSRQRLRINGFTAGSEIASLAPMVRNLLIMALRQSPLLSVVGDRSYQTSGVSSAVRAGVALPLLDLLTTARQEKANLVIDGVLDKTGDGLSLRLSVYDPAMPSPKYTRQIEARNERNLVDLAERAGRELRIAAFGESSLHSTYMPLEQITSASPEAVEFYLQAVFVYEQADADSALVLLDKAITLDPNFTLAHHYRALTLSAKSLLESAQISAERAFAGRSRVSERERNWIESLYYNIIGAWWPSAEALQKNTVLFPDEAVFERQLAFALARLGRYDQAIPHNRRALELDPFSENNKSELLENLAEANRAGEFNREVQKWTAEGRSPGLIHNARGLMSLQEGNYSNSLAEFRQLGSSNPKRESWSRLFSLSPLIMEGRFSEAIELAAGDLALDSSRLAGEKEESRTYRRRNVLGQLHRLKDASSLAAEHAEMLVSLPAVASNLIYLREGAALALDLSEIDLAERSLNRLSTVAARWPSSQSQGAVWLTQAMMKDIQGESGAEGLFAKAKGAWADPINLFYVARWEGKNGLALAQLDSLSELERLRGKVYKYHFAGLVVLGWLEQAKCLRGLARYTDSLRMYQRVVEHWGGPQAAGRLMHQALSERDMLQRRLH